MNRAPSAVAAAVVCAFALASASCIPDLDVCDFADVDGMTGVIDATCWARWCFVDADDDGWADATPLVDGDCGPDRIFDPDDTTDPDWTARTWSFGDCDDEDGNRYPGNLEVCDNVDNDCNGEPDFDEEDQSGPDGLPRCAPGRSVRLFISGGSSMNGQWFGAGSAPIKIAPGAPIVGQINLQAVIPDTTQNVAVVAVASWDGDRAGAGLRVILRPDEPVTDFDPSSPTIPFAGEFTAPTQPGEQNETISIIIAVADGGPVGTAEHLASLTHPRWCCQEPGDCSDPGEQAPCDPVWDVDALGGPPGEPVPGQLQLPSQLDLASLDELYLAPCHTLGVTRLPMLLNVMSGTQNDPEPCTDPLSPDCQQIYVSVVDAGCVEIKMEIDSETAP